MPISWLWIIYKNTTDLAHAQPRTLFYPISSNGSPPPQEKDWVKVSINGAMFEEKKFARLEAIVRNNNGLVMTIFFSQLIPLPSLVKMMEVLVARRAIWFAKEYDFEMVICEGDSEIITKAINSDGLPFSNFGHLINDIKTIFSYFLHSHFCHVHRKRNNVAHRLARRVRGLARYLVRMKSIPPDVFDVYN